MDKQTVDNIMTSLAEKKGLERAKGNQGFWNAMWQGVKKGERDFVGNTIAGMYLLYGDEEKAKDITNTLKLMSLEQGIPSKYSDFRIAKDWNDPKKLAYQTATNLPMMFNLMVGKFAIVTGKQIGRAHV